MTSYELLGVDPGTVLTRTKLRRAYLRRLRDFPPERDPEGFRALREAFEFLQRFASEDPARARPADSTSIVIDTAQQSDIGAEIFQQDLVREFVRKPDSAANKGENKFERSREAALAFTAGETSAVDEAPKDDDQASSAEKPALEQPFTSNEEARDQDPPTHNIQVGDGPFVDDSLQSPLPRMADPLDRPSTLPEMVMEILAHLIAGDLALAEDLERWWRDHAYIDDYRDADELVAVRWAQTRELMSAAGGLPGPVTKALALGISDNDVASACSALDAYRRAYPEAARNANTLLAIRAPSIHPSICGSLSARNSAWERAAHREESSSQSVPVPPNSQQVRNGFVTAFKVVFGFAWICVLIYVAGLIGNNIKSGPHIEPISPLLLQPPRPTIDFSTMCLSPTSSPFPIDSHEPEWLWHELHTELILVASHEATSVEQMHAAHELLLPVAKRNCKQIRSGMSALSSAEKTVHHCAHLVDSQLAGVEELVGALCPAKTKTRKKKHP